MIGRDDAGLDEVLRQLSRRGAGGFEWYKDSCLLRRIEVRMRARGVHSLSGYAALLGDEPEELERLLHTLSVRVTGFFRNPDSWLRLRELLEADPVVAERGITAWSMGCATGEESWSLAMLLLDLARRASGGAVEGVRVLASDVDSQALALAKAGRYPVSSGAAIREVLPRPYGSLSEGCFEVEPLLRPHVEFRREDLTVLPSGAVRFDLVCCRNLLIFLGREGQRRVLDAAVHALAPNGILMLGRTESLVALPEAGLVPVDVTHRLYRRLP
ncbi:MAG TPA: protein-glutamate O-methyltransferase CheR [Gemmatimonadales bacterium]